MADHYIYWRFLFWPQLAGVVFLVGGLIAVRRQLSQSLDTLCVLGRVFVPAALATFGAEHLASAQFIKDGVPAWIPWHLFWAYFVGLALFATAISFVANRYVLLSSWLFGLMDLIFILTIHIPNALHAPSDRVIWAVVTRDLLFVLGAWTLALTLTEDPRARRLLPIIRVLAAFILLFFAVEHFLHPAFAPGVPLGQETPAFIPVRPFWGYAIGALLAWTSVSILLKPQARMATTWLGIASAVLVPVIYIPMFAASKIGPEMNLAVNYIFDTLLLSGTVFLIAEGMGSRVAAANQSKPSVAALLDDGYVIQ